MYANPVVIFARSILRKLGLTPILSRWIAADQYEAQFNDAMFKAITAGSTVWDIGANVGLYTEKFANRAGTTGHVVAFEPSTSAFAILQTKLGLRQGVKLLNVALGEKDGRAAFDPGKGEADPTARLLDSVDESNAEFSVEVMTGATAKQRYDLATPNLIKIDVEGYEVEVLKGLMDLFADSACEHVFVEVHFNVLERRGQHGAVGQLCVLLKNAGFQLRWVDPSHVHGSRAAVKS